jgi:hypothetical protein
MGKTGRRNFNHEIIEKHEKGGERIGRKEAKRERDFGPQTDTD